MGGRPQARRRSWAGEQVPLSADNQVPAVLGGSQQSATCQQLGGGWTCKEHGWVPLSPGNILALGGVASREVLGPLCLEPHSCPSGPLCGSTSGVSLNQGNPMASGFPPDLEAQELECMGALGPRPWMNTPTRQDPGLQLSADFINMAVNCCCHCRHRLVDDGTIN